MPLPEIYNWVAEIPRNAKKSALRSRTMSRLLTNLLPLCSRYSYQAPHRKPQVEIPLKGIVCHMHLTLNVQTHNERWSPGKLCIHLPYTDFPNASWPPDTSRWVTLYSALISLKQSVPAIRSISSQFQNQSAAFVITKNKQLLVRWITVLIF